MPKKVTSHTIPLHAMPQFSAEDDAGRRVEIQNTIDHLNQRMIELSPSKDFSEEYLKLVADSKSACDKAHWSDAHLQLWNATFLVNRALESRNLRSLSINLAFAPLATFAAFFLLYLIKNKFGGFFHIILPDEYFKYLISGAIGGTTIAYWGIVKHNILMDFDDQYEMWYWFKPLLGGIFGIIAVLIMKAGVISLSVQTAAGSDAGQPEKLALNTALLTIIAFLAGFSERFFVRLIDRVMTAFFGGDSAPLKTQQPATPQPVPPGQPSEPSPHAQTISSARTNDFNDISHPGLP